MNKQEIIEKLKTRIELAESDIVMAANNFERAIAIVKKIFMNQTLGLIEQLDEPPQEPCEICGDKKRIIFKGKPLIEYRKSADGCPRDSNYCPKCGRKLESEERLWKQYY